MLLCCFVDVLLCCYDALLLCCSIDVLCCVTVLLGCCAGFFIADAAAMMVMELESRFPPSEVMDALSIVYPQFWLEPGHEDKLTGYMNTLKQTYAHTKDTCPAVLSATTLDRQLH